MTPLDRIRAICLSFDNVEERQSHGEASWFIQKGKQFAMFADHHHDDRLGCWIACDPIVQQGLIDGDPKRYFKPPYFGVRGWIGVYLDVDVDWEEATAILAEAHAMVQLKKRSRSS